MDDQQLPSKTVRYGKTIFLVIVIALLGFLLLRTLGLSPAWKSEQYTVEEKPGQAEGAKSQKDVGTEETASFQALARHLSGEEALGREDMYLLMEAYDVTDDELRFYLLLGQQTTGRGKDKNTKDYEKMIRKYRPAYWTVKEVVGNLVVKPAEYTDNADLLKVLSEPERSSQFFQKLARETKLPLYEIEEFARKNRNGRISDWAMLLTVG